jgi:hypothetical protein
VKNLSDSAQGTIEYLVVIGVVVVISLVVVGLLTSMIGGNSTGVSSSLNKISSSAGAIAITEAVMDGAGKSLFTITNNSGDPLTIKSIDVGGNKTNFDELISISEKRTFSLSDLNITCKCDNSGKKMPCEIVIETTTQYNFSKKAPITVYVDCVDDAKPKNPVSVVGLGDGTKANPWIINSCRELESVSNNLDGNYVLATDLNCFETRNWVRNGFVGFEPIGRMGADICGDDNPFRGTFDGKGHKIYSLYINGYSCGAALFDQVESTGEINNVHLVDADFSGGISGLVSYNYGQIINSSFTGTINSNSAGGIAFANYGTIDQCYSGANIYCSDTCGGLAGDTQGSISNSYSYGSVNSCNTTCGGLVGYTGTVTNSYSTTYVEGSATYIGGLSGALGNTTSSYWDTDTSGQSSSSSGVGKTTSEMQARATYVGWDFSNVWEIKEGVGYPTLINNPEN